MFLAHSFRLRDPWQCEALEGGALRWSRVFHRPTGLEDDDALWLVCAGLPAGAIVTFNGQAMAPYVSCATGVPQVRSGETVTPAHTGDTPVAHSSAPTRNEFDVTALLADANRIEIKLPSNLQPPASSLQPSAPFPFDVRLGIVACS
jgi:hypothetical protein